MKLQVLGSSSAGNAYVLNDDFIIELGLPDLEIKKAIGFKPEKIVAALVSHKHQDHAKSIRKFAGLFPIVAPSDAIDAAQIAGIRGVVPAREMKGIKIGNYKILPLKMQHDCECYGYLICFDNKTLGFFTDTSCINYNLPQLDYIMIEANYSSDQIDRQLFEGVVPKFLADRIRRSHLSVESALSYVLKQEKLKAIILIHLSENNGNPEGFKSLIERKTGTAVYVAEKGKVIEIL